MIIDLDKSDLIKLVKGSQPYFSVMSNKLIARNGTYYDNKGWVWSLSALEKLSEQELYEIFKLCKDSWE